MLALNEQQDKNVSDCSSQHFKSVFIKFDIDSHWVTYDVIYALLPSENSHSPAVEAGGSHGHMSPEEHYRRMMSALSEQGSYEEQQQRLYQLASSMGLPSHGQSTDSLCECLLH